MFRLESTGGPCSFSGRRRAQGPGADGAQCCQPLWGALLGEGAALGWDAGEDPGRAASGFSSDRRLLCRRGGGAAVGSSLALCDCLSQTPPRGPFLTRSLPWPAGGDAKAVRGAL